MTKTEVKKLPVDELRALLEEHFEIEGEATVKQLRKIVDDNWDDFLNDAINPDGGDEDDEPSGPKDLTQPDLATDLYSGVPRR